MRNRGFYLASIVAVTLLEISPATAIDADQAAPLGFDQSILYYGTGVVDMSVDSPVPGLTGCAGSLQCTGGTYFQKVIMHLSDAQIAASAQEAKDFFKTRFGITVDDAVRAGLVSFKPFMANPNVDYRAYVYRGKFLPHVDVPLPGWVVRDGGWNLTVTASSGLDLGGEYQGVHVPSGAFMVRGNYNILATDDRGRPIREIIIDYRSGGPLISQIDGSLAFRCELDAADITGTNFKEGLAVGQFAVSSLGGSRVKANVRNALTFPPDSRIDNLLSLTKKQIQDLVEAQVRSQLK